MATQLDLFHEATPEEMLQEFQEKFQTPNTPEFWLGLVREEHKEVLEAAENFLKEISDLVYVGTGFENAGGDPEVLNEELQNLDGVVLDLIKAIEPGLKLEAFRRVHLNNMSKVHPDGTVKRREDGKILKPSNYQPVDLSDLVR